MYFKKIKFQNLSQKDSSLLKFPDRKEKYFDEIQHDSDDIFSSSPELTSLTNTHPSQHIESDIEDLFASSPPNDSPTTSSNAKKAKISSQKRIDTTLKPKHENEDDSDWDDDSFWNTINFDTQQ